MDPEATPKGTVPLTFLAPAQAPDEIGRLAHFRVLRLVGRGGMGIVFEAEDTRLERPVALKVMRPEVTAIPEAVSRFLREARAAAAVKDEHVITVYETGQDGGVPFLAMELLTGASLQDWLKQGRSAGLGQIVEIGRGIAQGLTAAHAHGMVHRDIKPSNVWLEAPDGRVKILDFGLARATQSDSGLTHVGAVVGTPQFMSPEQASGQSVDHRSDLFSLGCILYQLSTGRLPFPGKTPVAVLTAIALETAPRVTELNPAIPARMAKLIARLLAKDPADRPASAAEVVKELDRVKQELLQAGHSFAIGRSAVAEAVTPTTGSTVSLDRARDEAGGGPTRGRRRLRRVVLVSAAVIGLVSVAGFALRWAGGSQQWRYADLEREPDSWKVYTEGTPKWECGPAAVGPGEAPVLRCFLAGGAPYSNAHFYRNLPATGSDRPKRFTLSLSFRFSPTTYNNQGGKSVVQALEFTTSEWRAGRRHEFALQWLNVGANAPCWRYWVPQAEERWRDLSIPSVLEADRWHTLRLEGLARGDVTSYQRFAIDDDTHQLAVTALAVPAPDDPDRVAVGLQLDGNSHQDPYEVFLKNVSLTIDGE